MSYDHLMIVVS